MQPLITRPFDFEKVFPIMYSMLNKNNETFRWFQYSNDILRVLVGRGVGQCHRDFESRNFLKTRKRKFNSENSTHSMNYYVPSKLVGFGSMGMK